jgi:hypothetical protein
MRLVESAVDDVRPAQTVSLATIARQWARIGAFGFGGPPALIALLRRLCVQERAWISETEFQDGIAAANLLPGPAALQLGIYCAWRLRGAVGAVIAGVCLSLPGLVVILGLSVLFLAKHPEGCVYPQFTLQFADIRESARRVDRRGRLHRHPDCGRFPAPASAAKGHVAVVLGCRT